MAVDVFAPLKIGALQLPNRIVLAPVKTAFGGSDGLVTPQHIAYYRRRAEGGAGLIIVEPLFVDPKGREHPRQLGVHGDDSVQGLRDIVAAVREYGSRIIAHLNHAGRAANPKAIGGPPEAPSSVTCPTTGATPEPMTGERIAQVLEAYGRATQRAREAGFDGVELQLGLGYLPAQFLSPRTNLRSDEYGHVGADRWRFVRELVAVVRANAADGLALIARVSADEKVEGGLGPHDAIQLAERLQAWDVDAVHVVTGSACDSPPWYYQHMALPTGVNERLAARIHSAVTLPVIVAGRLGEPDRLRRVLENGMADAIALGRPLVADPDLPRKIREGRELDIITCGACLQGCLAKVKEGGPIGCIVNPELGHEIDRPLAAAALGERLVVVGGGPAGMEAAVTARRAGLSVTLLERRGSLGGQFTLAPLTAGKEAMERPLRSMINAVEQSGVEIRTAVDATVDTILGLEPDHVVIATGSRPITPPIPGLADPLTAEQVLTGAREPGTRVLILGGGLVGIEMAEHLGLAGHEVVVVELLSDVARDMEAVTRKMVLKRLETLPVAVLESTRLVSMKDDQAVVAATDDGRERSLGAFDSVLVAVGQSSFDPLSEELQARGLSVTVVGDAFEPRQIIDATRSGRDAVESIVYQTGRSSGE